VLPSDEVKWRSSSFYFDSWQTARRLLYVCWWTTTFVSFHQLQFPSEITRKYIRYLLTSNKCFFGYYNFLIVAKSLGHFLCTQTQGPQYGVVRVSDLRSKGPGFDPRAVPKMWIHVRKYLPLLNYILCYIMYLIDVSVCKTVNSRHWVSLAPLFGSVYITVLNCVCDVMFIWWFVSYYLHCPAW